MSKIIGTYQVPPHYFESTLSINDIKNITKTEIASRVINELLINEEKYFTENKYNYFNEQIQITEFRAVIFSVQEFQNILDKIFEIKVINNNETVDGLLSELKIMLKQ